MTSYTAQPLAVARDYLVGIAPLVIGVIIVIGLIMAVWYGMIRRAREPAPPQEPQPRAGAWHTRQELGERTPPDHGPGHQDGEPVEYEEATQEAEELGQVPKSQRLRPHEIRTYPGPRTGSGPPDGA